MTSFFKNPLHIVYLGEAGFPYGYAPIQRQLLISRGLVEAGAQVLVISNKGIFEKDQLVKLTAKGTYKGVDYEYTSESVIREKSFIWRNALKIKGVFKEFMLLWSLKRKRKLDFAIVATMRFQQILYYFLLSRLFGFKILLNYVELNSAIITRTRWRDRVNDYLVDLWAFKCADAVLPISDFLAARITDESPGKPFLKIPILSDSSNSFPKKLIHENGAFVYCGSATYIELIKFILDSFALVTHHNKRLHLVVSGDPVEMDIFYNLVYTHPANEHITTFSQIPFAELCQLYRDASALLIPLRPTIQDQARFPHKIGEYLASGNPIVTTNYGEIATYFTDMETALIAEEYTPESFALKMTYVIEHPDIAARIGRAGEKLAGKEFAYEKHGRALLSFIKSLR